jgi:hypothetical protein
MGVYTPMPTAREKDPGFSMGQAGPSGPDGFRQIRERTCSHRWRVLDLPGQKRAGRGRQGARHLQPGYSASDRARSAHGRCRYQGGPGFRDRVARAVYNDEPYTTAMELAVILDQFPRYPKMRPCGVMISRDPIRDISPTFSLGQKLDVAGDAPQHGGVRAGRARKAGSPFAGRPVGHARHRGGAQRKGCPV